MRRRDLLTGAAATVGAAVAPIRSAAADFPNRPITLLVPWVAGGPADTVLRALAEIAGKELGVPVICENKAGASGTLAPATMAANAKP